MSSVQTNREVIPFIVGLTPALILILSKLEHYLSSYLFYKEARFCIQPILPALRGAKPYTPISHSLFYQFAYSIFSHKNKKHLYYNIYLITQL